jgi:HEPN domain-containing protein
MSAHAKADPKALGVAKAVYEAISPNRVILFGSRARGDHREAESDIDILIVSDQAGDAAVVEDAESAARQRADTLFNHDVPIQLLWRTTDEFQQTRRTINGVVARAIDEGIIMPEDLENDRNQDNDYAHEWTITDQRVEHAEIHLDGFQDLAQRGRNDRLIGKNAQEAMEHALKALISAYGVRYQRTHDLNKLLQQVNEADPGFMFQPRSSYRVLDQYSGDDDYYRPKEFLTDSPTYYEDVVSDVRTLLARVSELTPEEDRNREHLGTWC